MKNITAAIAALFILCGCSVNTDRALSKPESALSTDGKTAMLYHSVLYYPAEISLNFPGYIVGIEKSPVKNITRADDILVDDVAHAGLSKEHARKKIVDSKIMYISHVIKNTGETYGLKNCALYNAYVQPGDNKTQQLVPTCKSKNVPPVAPQEAYKSSWQALEALANDINSNKKSGAKSYSHVLVITMGWNTIQEEAVRNFNSIVKGIKNASDDAFNPLVIGVTWPSQWQGDWFDPLIKLASFFNKNPDADEVGLTWLGALIHKTLPEVADNLPVVIIGHSFGAKAATTAACAGPAIHAPGSDNTRYAFKNIKLINLQGAFQTDRFWGKRGGGGITFSDQCSNIPEIYLTSSQSDEAMNTVFWGRFFGRYTGDDVSYNKECNEESQRVNCATVDHSGNIQPVKNHNRCLTYVEADRLIHQNAYLSGGEAHSDIYRLQHGKMMWQMIQSRPPTHCNSP